MLATVGVACFMVGSYLLLTHPFITIGAVLVGVNIVVFSLFKLG
jgi:hypothetical protein